MMDIKQLKSQARALSPILNVGKNGITEAFIEEVKKTIKKKKLIKIKLNKSALEGKDKKELAAELVEKTGSELIDFVGFNIVLFKKS